MNTEQTESSSIATPASAMLAGSAAVASPVTPRTTTISGAITGSVPEMIAAVADAAVALAPAPFVVQYDEGEWIIAVADQDDPEACTYTDAESRRTRAVAMVELLLPTWARSSTHEAQQRTIDPVVYAQQYPTPGATASWRVTLDAPNDWSVWSRPGQSRAADIVAASADEAAQLLWHHLGCPRSAGLMIVPAVGEAIWYNVDDWTIPAGSPYWEPVHTFPARTRAGSISDLPVGTDPVVAAIHASRTAGDRAASRARAAKDAIVQYVLDETYDERSPMHSHVAAWVADGGDDPLDGSHWWIGIPGAMGFDSESSLRVVAAIAAMELHGVGGPGGIDGGATATMSWRAALGKGRRNASDGAAWDAAIRSLVQLPSSLGSTGHLGDGHVRPEDVMLALPFVRPHDLLWPMSYALSRAYEWRHSPEIATAWCDVTRAVMARAQEPGAPLDGPAVMLGRRYGL